MHASFDGRLRRGRLGAGGRWVAGSTGGQVLLAAAAGVTLLSLLLVAQKWLGASALYTAATLGESPENQGSLSTQTLFSSSSLPEFKPNPAPQAVENLPNLNAQTHDNPLNWTREDLQTKKFSFSEHLALTKLVCGPICSLPRKLEEMPYKDLGTIMTVQELQQRFVETQVNCPALFSPLAELLFDTAAQDWPPPRQMPSELAADYTLGWRMSNGTKYFKQRYAGRAARVPQWTKKMVDEWITQATTHVPVSPYGLNATRALKKGIIKADLTGMHVLVVGSESPWVEALCLAMGAVHVTTLEYGKIQSLHPQVSTLLPSELTERFNAGLNEEDKYDAVVIFSSIEHSGLGRYGDTLNPWSDVVAAARVWCVMKPNAQLVIGLPGCRFSLDHIDWNGNRNYGRLRLGVLLQNFLVLDIIGVEEDGISCVTRLNPRGNDQFVVVAKKIG